MKSVISHRFLNTIGLKSIERIITTTKICHNHGSINFSIVAN